MRFLIRVHRCGPEGRAWCYDVFYRPSLADKLLRRRPDVEQDNHEYVYDFSSSSWPIDEYARRGWRYLFSGDTFWPDEVLAKRGLEGRDDLEGLKRWLLSRFPEAELEVHTCGGRGHG